MTDVDRISAKFASMSADRTPSRGAIINGGGGGSGGGRPWSDVGGAVLGQGAAHLKPHAQAKLLSPTEKCKVRTVSMIRI
jgi:hypothetical protein